MLIVPELKTVFILVPRTGTGTLYRAMRATYPKAMLLYRHMEACGVPLGYDRWRRIGFVRHPVARLYSLYSFMQNFGGGAQVQGGAASADAERVRRQVQGRSFNAWLLENHEPWTNACDLAAGTDYWPVLARRNTAPENRLSQFAYLRPDMGTEVRHFTDLPRSMEEWGLGAPQRSNVTDAGYPPAALSEEAEAHLHRFCAWDFKQGCAYL